MEQEQEQKKLRQIPFVKPARIGNFKIWKSKYELSVEPTEEQRKNVAVESDGKKMAKRQNVDIECINVSVLDGSWMVRIPQTFEQFSMISLAYTWSQSEDNEERSRGLDYLRTAISNMFYVSCICNGFFHHGVEMVASAYADPSLLGKTKRGKAFLKDAKGTIKRFLAWREEFDKLNAGNELSEQDLLHEEIAENAMEILSEGEKKE